MNLGKSVTFEAAGRRWSIKPFSIDALFQFCEYLKSRPKDYDPLERVSKLPLEKMPAEMVERMVREAIDEDKQLHDFRPESEATKRALSSIDGVIKAIAILSGESDDEVRSMVLTLAREDRIHILSDAIAQTIGGVEKKVTMPVQAEAA